LPDCIREGISLPASSMFASSPSDGCSSLIPVRL
jgi:hypothetical protein